jgi:hypothetical protein
MDISSFSSSFVASVAAPAPGAAKPGNLYADLQSRTLWLGVDPAVDAAGALLISDIVALTDAIAESYDDSKTYTDSQILTRAPTVHSHTAAQITDFSGAVEDVVNDIPGFNWVRGMIMMWSGSLAEIGVGGLAGWALCDGSNGTPNLRDRFVIGAGNKVPGATNPLASLDTNDAGQHVHTVAGTALSVAQLPSHAHSVSGSASVSGTTGLQNANHVHASESGGRQVMVFVGGGGGQGTTGGGIAAGGSTTGAEQQNHAHAFSGAGSIAGTAAAVGSGSSHTHGLSFDGTHHHNITSQQLRDATPYYALAFIMKL